MSTARPQELQTFVDALKAAFDVTVGATDEVLLFRFKLFTALATPGAPGTTPAAHLPVCNHINSACKAGSASSPLLANLAKTFQILSPRLTWKVRPSSGPHASSNWHDNHANAVIIGEGGLEERSDIAIGASLMAPHVRYPDHTHPPEELYMILTPGRFRHGGEAWCEPGPGGTFHNSPGITHAMASTEMPLLAFWTMLAITR